MPSDVSPTPLLPGIKPVLELLHDDPQRLDHVYCKKGLRSREILEIQQRCRHAGIRYTLVEQQALDRLCREEGAVDTAHQGVMARLCAASFQPLEQLLADAMHAPLPLLVALDQVPFTRIIEIEGEPKAIETAERCLHLDKCETSTKSYHALHQEWRGAQGLPPQLSFVFEEPERTRLREALGLTHGESMEETA